MRPAGFTIVEMLAVLVILGTLATTALPLVELTTRRNKELELKHALREIRRAIDAYKEASDQGRIARVDGASGYPPSLDALVKGEPAADGSQRMYWLRRVPADPFVPRKAGKPEWGVRSYASPPDAPQPGADVYDVYSLSHDVSISGVPYREW